MILDVCTHHWTGASPWYSLRGGKPGGICGVGPTGIDESRDRTADARVILGYASDHLNVHIPYESVAARIARDEPLSHGFVGIDPLDEGAEETLRRALELGASGVVVSPADQDCRPTHERFMLVMESCAARGLPVMVSNPGLRCASARLTFACPSLLEEAAGAFPKLTLVLGELRVNREHALLMVARHENVYAETSSLIDNPSALHGLLLSAHHMGVTEKFLFGSGSPFVSAAEAVQRIFSINKMLADPGQTVPREQLRSIVERDAWGLLGLEKAGAMMTRDVPAAPTPQPERALSR